MSVVGQPQREPPSAKRLDAELEPRAAVQPLALRARRRRRWCSRARRTRPGRPRCRTGRGCQLLLRRVRRRCSACAPAGTARRLRPRRVERAKVSVSKRRVRTSATKSPGCGSSDQVSRLRSLRSRLNDLPTSSSKTRCARRNARASTATGVEHAVAELLLELERVEAHERRGERRVERLGAREDPHLAALFLRLRRKQHGAVAEEHERGDAVRRLGDEDVAGGQPQLEDRRTRSTRFCAANCFSRMQRQAMQPVDRGQRLLRDDRARAGARSASRGLRMSRRQVVIRPRAPGFDETRRSAESLRPAARR